MILFLLLLSLALNAGCIYAIILLYMRQNGMMKVEKDNKRLIKEMEEIFSGYMLELKEENESFLRQLSSIQQKEKNLSVKEIDDSEDAVIKNGNSGEQIAFSVKVPSASRSVIEKAYTALESEPRKQKKEALVDTIKELKEEGRSTEEIAKLLNKGKTEVELMLKLQKK